MKILYHHRIASKDGQYVHVSEILNSLTKKGNQITLVAPAMQEKQQFGGEVGLVVKLKRSLPKAIYEILEFSYSFFDFAKMCVAVMKQRPDIIYERYNLYFLSGILISKIFGIKLILEVNAPLYDERSKYGGLGIPKFANWCERFTWRKADYVLPVTEVLQQRIANSGVPKSKMKVIANGINPDHFMQSVPPMRIPGFSPQQLVIGFVGFCHAWHKLDKVIELVAQEENHHLNFVIVGDGEIIPTLKEQVKNLGCESRVYFAGLAERKEIPRWLAAFDIALQPAVVPYASPLKVIEYLATGKAIVAPNQSNIRELLTHEYNALLFDKDNTEQFIAAIQRLIEDSSLRQQLSENAKETIVTKELFWDKNAEKIVAIAQGLL